MNYSSPETSEGYRVLSIDPGSRKGLGICIATIKDNLMVVDHAATLDILYICKLHERPDDLSNRLHVLRKTLLKLCLDWDVQAIVAEDCYFSGMPQAYKALVSVLLGIESVSESLFGIGSLIKITASKVKTAVAVSGKSGDKCLVKTALLDIASRNQTLVLPTKAYYDLLDEHAIDAIAIGYALHAQRLEQRYSPQ